MLTSVHVADVGPKAPLWRPPKSIAGLTRADGGMTARLSSSAKPAIEMGRIAMIASWQSESSLDSFLDTVGREFRDGWSARCEVIRASGKWPGVPTDVPSERTPEKDEPVIVVSRAQIHLPKLATVLKFNAEANGAMLMSDSLRWGTTFSAGSLFGSITMWRSAEAMAKAAYDVRSGFGNVTALLKDEVDGVRDGEGFHGEGGHRGAMGQNVSDPLYKEFSYVRLRPLSIKGTVVGKNPLNRQVFDD